MATKKKAVWEWKIVRGAIGDAFLKLSPRKMMGKSRHVWWLRLAA